MTSVVEVKPNPNVQAFAPGDTVKVSVKIVEGEKERTQVFQGVVIKVRRGGVGSSFTVRRVTHGVGVERTFPFYSPLVEKVEVVRHGKVRRAKLYYLRGLSAKAARIKERRLSRQEIEMEREAAQKLKQEQKLRLEKEAAEKLEQEEEPKQELEQEPEQKLEPEQELKQEPEQKLEQEEEPRQELEQEPEQKQEEEQK